MNSLIKYMQLQHLDIDDASLNALRTAFISSFINSPNLIGTTFRPDHYNNINFVTEKNKC